MATHGEIRWPPVRSFGGRLRGGFHGRRHLGSNIGGSVLFFRRKYPGARIIAVEPSPDLAAVLRRNVRTLDVEVRQVAVSSTPGKLAFIAAPESWAGTTAKDPGEGIEVDAV